MLFYNPNATVDDGSCVEPLPGCLHPGASNFDSLANVDDASCRFNIPGCTNPAALNYFFLAEIDDGSCIFIGCTSSSAPNYNPTATVDDGSCAPTIPGCLDSRAVNFLVVANVDDGSCLYAGCTDSEARNYQSWAQLDDGSCAPYVHGCRDSSAANYDSNAERDAPCLYYGCTASMATNFDESASVDDGSCAFVSVSGALASFGYLRDCRVFLDGYGASFSADGTRGHEDPYDRSSAIGHYTVVYRDPGVLNVQSADAAAGFACTDTVTGSSLDAPLRTFMNATMATPLTTVATALVGATLSTPSVGGEPILLANVDFGQLNGTATGMSTAVASDLVCQNLIPSIACGSSFQPCDVTTGYADVCTLDGARLSVFHFDALDQYIHGTLPDPAWSAWLVAQINSLFSVGCATNALMCASPALCGSYCELICGAQGVQVGAFSKEAVGTAVFFALAEMTAAGPANLEDMGGAGVAELIAKASARLGVAPINEQGLAQSCGMQNFITYMSLTGQGGAGRRALGAATADADAADATSALPQDAEEAEDTDDDEMPSAASGVVDDGGLVESASARVARVCDALQPEGGSCRRRLARVLARLASEGRDLKRRLHSVRSPPPVSRARDGEVAGEAGGQPAASSRAGKAQPLTPTTEAISPLHPPLWWLVTLLIGGGVLLCAGGSGERVGGLRERARRQAARCWLIVTPKPPSHAAVLPVLPVHLPEEGMPLPCSSTNLLDAPSPNSIEQGSSVQDSPPSPSSASSPSKRSRSLPASPYRSPARRRSEAALRNGSDGEQDAAMEQEEEAATKEEEKEAAAAAVSEATAATSRPRHAPRHTRSPPATPTRSLPPTPTRGRLSIEPWLTPRTPGTPGTPDTPFSPRSPPSVPVLAAAALRTPSTTDSTGSVSPLRLPPPTPLPPQSHLPRPVLPHPEVSPRIERQRRRAAWAGQAPSPLAALPSWPSQPRRATSSGGGGGACAPSTLPTVSPREPSFLDQAAAASPSSDAGSWSDADSIGRSGASSRASSPEGRRSPRGSQFDDVLR